MKKAILVTMTALALAALLPATASAQATANGTMAVDINLPNLIILYYYSDVTVNIDATDLVNGTGGVDLGDVTGTGGLTADLGITNPTLDSPLSNLSDVTLTLENAWAVRSLSTTGNVSVSLQSDQASLPGASGSIGINDVTVIDADSNSVTSTGPTTAASISIQSPGLVNAAVGDFAMGLDLTSTRSSGTYGGTFTIVASAP